MSPDNFQKLYEWICIPNKFLSESTEEVMGLCSILELDKVKCIAEILSEKKSVKNCTPDQLLIIMETIMKEYRKIQEVQQQKTKTLHIEQAIKIREAKKRVIDELFLKVIVMKLLYKYL